MPRRTTLLTLALLLLSGATPALADEGKDDSGGDDNSGNGVTSRG